QAAEILAFVEVYRSAVDFRDVADDVEAEPGSRLAGVQPGAAIEDIDALVGRDAGAVVLNLDLNRAGIPAYGREHAAAAIFGGIFDEVAEHLVEILPFDPGHRLLVAGEVDGDILIKPADRALDRFQRRPDRRPRLGAGPPSDRPCPRQMVVDLAPHRRRF